MAIELKVRQALVVNGNVVVGDRLNDTTITLASGQQFCATDVTVADNYGTALLWTSGDGGMTSYSHGWVYSDKDVVIELRSDNGTAEFVLMFVEADVLTALPAEIGGDTTESLDGAILVDGTDHDTVDRVEVQNNVADAIGDASVSIFLFV